MVIDAIELARARRMIPTSARELRQKAGLSLREAATAVDVSESSLSLWERGKAKPRGPAALRYLRLLEALGREEELADAG